MKFWTMMEWSLGELDKILDYESGAYTSWMKFWTMMGCCLVELDEILDCCGVAQRRAG
jgi:hypothetical protein